ncbi:MAG: hypothetical protein ABIO49_16300 [Dokdonella sp.]
MAAEMRMTHDGMRETAVTGTKTRKWTNEWKTNRAAQPPRHQASGATTGSAVA